MKSWAILVLIFSLQAFGHGGGEAVIEVGADKGVLEVSKDRAFRLAPEAYKRLEIASIPVSGPMMSVSNAVIAHSLKESTVFRIRGGWIKSIPFKTVSKSEGKITLQSKDLLQGDLLVTQGVGFLRIIALQLGAEETGEAGHDEAGHLEEGHHD